MKPRKKIELNKELIEAGFKVKGNPVSSKFISRKFGNIDFRTMKVKQAESLIIRDFPYLSKSSKKELKE